MSNAVPTWPQATHTLTVIGQQNPTLQQLRQLHDGPLAELMQAIKNGTLLDRDTVRKFYGLPLLRPEVFDLTINYGLTRFQMMDAARVVVDDEDEIGEFWIYGRGTVELEVRLFHVGCENSLEGALSHIKMAETGPWSWIPGKIEHLISLRAAGYQDESAGYPIVALGSILKFDDARKAPVLRGNRLSAGTVSRSMIPVCFPADVRFIGFRPKKAV